MKHPPRRKKGSTPSRPATKPSPSTDPASGGRRRLLLLLGFGIIVVGVAGVIRYRAESNPLLRIPPVETKDLLPDVAKELELRQADIVTAPDSPEAWGTYGLVLLAHDFRNEAAACFVEAEELDDRDYRWPYYFGMTMGTTDATLSLQAFQRAVDKAPDRVTVRLRLAEWLFDLRQLEECEQQVQEALRSEPDNPRAQLLIARLRFLEGQIEESHDWAQRAATSPKGNRRDVHELLAQTYMRLGQTTAAESEVEQAEALPRGVAVWDDPEMGIGGTMMRDASILNTLASIHLSRGDKQQWLDLLRQVVVREPNNIRAKEKFAQALMELKKFDEAAKFIDATLRKYPDFSQFECLRGQIELERGNTDAARQRFERAARLKRDYADAYLWWGRSLFVLDQHPQAIAALQEAVRLSPSLATAYDYLGTALLANGQPAEAINAFRHATDLKPGVIEFALHLAQALITADRLPEARQILQTIVRSAEDPSEAKALLEKLERPGSEPTVPPAASDGL